MAHSEEERQEILILTVNASLDRAKVLIANRPEESVECARYLHEVYLSLRELARREGLTADDKINIVEQLRRVERLIGQTIKRGQSEGKIATRGSIGGYATEGITGSLSKVRSGGRYRGDQLLKPGELLGYSTAAAMSFFYYMAEPVTEDQFESVMEKALAEHRYAALARNKIVADLRRISKRDPNFNLKQIRNLAANGHSLEQIVSYTGMRRSRVRELVRRHNIDLPGDYGRLRAVDDSIIVKRTVEALEGIAAALEVFDPDRVTNTDDQDHWVESVARSIKALVKFHKQLKDM